MKKNFFYLIAVSFVLFILLLNLVCADFKKGSPAAETEKDYGEGEILRGWINISLEDEPIDSEFSCFDKTIELIDFLDELEAEYTCSDECEEGDSLSADFQILDLEAADFKVPSKGKHSAVISLDDVVIISKSIEVQEGLKIFGINTRSAVAANPTKFIIYIFGKNITKYTWDFGDDTDEETTINQVTHTYDEIDEYNLEVKIENDKGGIVKESFVINVSSPKNAINETIISKKAILNKVKNQTSVGWYKAIVEGMIGLDEAEQEIKKLEAEYKKADEDNEYVDIMAELVDLEMPISFGASYLSSGDYFPDPEQIDAEYLADMMGEVDNSEDYNNAIVSWFNEHIDMKIKSEIYSVTYSDYYTDYILTSFKITIRPKKDFSREVYLIIDSLDISFKEDYEQQETDWATGITFSELKKGQEKTVEFVLEEEMDIIELPIYLSPGFSQLNIADISPCNFNGRCEPDLEENWKNCRSDCKPIGRTLIYIAIVLFFAFVIYIVLQEWYKINYEKHLFGDRRDLFNLVGFINNALNQGFSKSEIVKRLRKNKWSKEQIIYAFKKVKGKRTGMLEIPIFKIFRRKKTQAQAPQGMQGMQRFQRTPMRRI